MSSQDERAGANGVANGDEGLRDRPRPVDWQAQLISPAFSRVSSVGEDPTDQDRSRPTVVRVKHADTDTADAGSQQSPPRTDHLTPSLPALSRRVKPTPDDRSLSTKANSLQPPNSTDYVHGEILHSNRSRLSTSEDKLRHMRSKILNRDLWMKDENANACYACGLSFSTFLRRKHHCRLCGMIFCHACSRLISGKPFGHASKLRVCKTCEGIINGDDSSDDYSDADDFLSPVTPRQIRFSESPDIEAAITHDPQANLRRSLTADTGAALHQRRESVDRSLAVTFPPVLARPSSSRSLKSLAGRPRSSRSHRRSRQHTRSLGSAVQGAPFLHNTFAHVHASSMDLPAFHTSAVIDPELSAFLSDEESSDDDAISLATALHGEAPAQSSSTLSSVLGVLRRRKSKSLIGSSTDLTQVSRDIDEIRPSSSRAGPHTKRHLRPRTVSSSSVTRFVASPRLARSDNLFHRSLDLSWNNEEDERRSTTARTPRILTRHNTVEACSQLNDVSLQHLKRMLRQLLLDKQIEHPRKWEKVLMPILLRCAEEVDPSVDRGDRLDVRNYVKLKKAAGGLPRDSLYVSGIVFTQSLALRNMPRTILSPRILLLSFPLTYVRPRNTSQIIFMDPLISQEREYLHNVVERIKLLRPNVILAQHEVAGLALSFLHEAKIAVAQNVKESVLQAISRCAQTRIISSVNKLTISSEHLGTCASLEVKTYVYNNRRKSLLFLSGCRPDLGCTILVRGPDIKELRKVKRFVEFLCYVAYNLKLESCLMRDERIAVLPDPQILTEGPVQDAPKNVQQADGAYDEKDLTVAITEIAEQGTPHQSLSHDQHLSAENVSQQTMELAKTCEKQLAILQKRIISASSSVKLDEPYYLLRGCELEQQITHLKELLRTHDDAEDDEDEADESPRRFELVKPEMIYNSSPRASSQVKDLLRAIHAAELTRCTQLYDNLRKRWESYIADVAEPFSPINHQLIITLYSLISTPTGRDCDGPDTLGFYFYQEVDTEGHFEVDIPLGEYVERCCNQANAPCATNSCDKAMIDHRRQYVHRDGQLTVSIRKLATRIAGLQNTILMWSRCKICNEETEVTPMSTNSWKFSFAKYLELTFWSQPLLPMAGSCNHDVHHDHMRFFGYKNLGMRMEYEKVNILKVIVPTPTVRWNFEKDLKMKNELYEKTTERLGRFISSVKLRLRGINLENVAPEKFESCKVEVERLDQRASTEYDMLIKKLQEKYAQSKYYEIVPMNRGIRFMQEKIAEWDEAFENFEMDYLPSEKDIRKLAAQQLRRAYLDSGDDTVQDGDDEKGRISIDALPNDSSESVGDPEKYLDRPGVSPELPSTPYLNDVASSIRRTSVILEDYQHRADAAIVTDEQLDRQVVQSLDLAISPKSPSSQVASTSPNSKVDARADLETFKRDSPRPKLSPPRTSVGGIAIATASASTDKPKEMEMTDTTGETSTASRPMLMRSHTEPTLVSQQTGHEFEDDSINEVLPTIVTSTEPKSPDPMLGDDLGHRGATKASKDRPALPTTKSGKRNSQSMIPRAIANKRQESKVSALAKHFEQITRDFEQKRIRERRQRAAKTRQARAFPTASSKPMVEIFRDANEAVRESDVMLEQPTHDQTAEPGDRSMMVAPRNGLLISKSSKTNSESLVMNFDTLPGSTLVSEESLKDGEDGRPCLSEAHDEAGLADSDQTLDDLGDGTASSALEAQIDFPLEIPKHEKSLLMKMLTSFWSERSSSGWTALEYPLTATDHLFTDSDIIVREDEPSSVVAFILASEDYNERLRQSRDRTKVVDKEQEQQQQARQQQQQQQQHRHRKSEQSSDRPDNLDTEVERDLLVERSTHMIFGTYAGSARIQCKVFFAEAFDALRRKCGVADRFIESMSRCLRWDSKGGRTKAIFLRTLDERFILKSLSAVETQAFLKFAPDYFDYMSRTLFHSLPSAMAKMIGFYQVVIKNPATGTDFSCFLQVMENVFYEGPPSRMFDVKGSMRNRRIESTGERNEVLQDENLLEFVSQSPIYVRHHSNGLLATSVSNDTRFCAQQNVMDYSLIVGLYEERKELVVGIIDYIRTYTWDKKLESWMKDRGKHRPTVRSPKEYRARFRQSLPIYFPLAPSCWQVFNAQRDESADEDGGNVGPSDGAKARSGSNEEDEEGSDGEGEVGAGDDDLPTRI